LTSLIDDAAVFPPGSAALPDAVDAHRRIRQSPACTSVGPLLVPVTKVPALLDLLEDPAEPLAIGIVGVPGDAAGLIRAARLAAGRTGLTVAGLEIGCGGRGPDELITELEALGESRGQTARDISADVPLDVPLGLALEIDRGHPEQLEAVAARTDQWAPGRLRGKFRTGGVEPGAVPSADELAAVLGTAVRLALPIKLTAGLHHAVRSAQQHGVLNILLAVDAAFDRPADAGRVLEEDDAERLAAELISWDADRVARTRSIFTSFGCCGVLEPLAEAARLGVVGRVAHDLTVPKEHR
jgi:hypothetical protein